jgi:hypothetical protein
MQKKVPVERPVLPHRRQNVVARFSALIHACESLVCMDESIALQSAEQALIFACLVLDKVLYKWQLSNTAHGQGQKASISIIIISMIVEKRAFFWLLNHDR